MKERTLHIAVWERMLHQSTGSWCAFHQGTGSAVPGENPQAHIQAVLLQRACSLMKEGDFIANVSQSSFTKYGHMAACLSRKAKLVVTLLAS